MQAMVAGKETGARILGRPPLPREHGAWAMLLIPLVVGLAASGRWGVEGPLYLGTCLALYVARQPITMILKSLREPSAEPGFRPKAWLAIYMLVALACGVPLLYPYGRWLLLPWAVLFGLLTAIHLFLRKKKLDRTPAAEITVIGGLALTAPGAYYVAGGFDATAIYLWLLTTLYSGSSVFYVRMKMRHRALRRTPAGANERFTLAQASLSYLAILVGIIGLLAFFGQVPTMALVAFVPLAAKVIHGALAGGPEVNIKQIGWTEVAHSVVFTALLIAAYVTDARL